MAETGETEERRKAKTIPGIGLPAGSDYPNIGEIPTEQCQEVYWRKEVSSAFEMANNGYSFYRIPEKNSIFAKDLSGYWYKLNNETRCFEFLFEGFKDTTDYTRINLPPQAPTFVGFNFLHQAVFPMNDDGKPILPKDDKGKTIFPFYDGYPLFPVDDSGAICIPLGDDGKPVFPRIYEEYGAYVPCDVTGRVVLPMNEKGEPCYPRDEEGNVLMPFVISEDGTRKRAVYTDDDGTPILPFHNGEHALEVHEGEVLFQYEYQQKMMILAQFTAGKGVQTTNNQLMDEQFYQKHAAHYQNQMDLTTTSSEPSESLNTRKPPIETQKTANPAANLLLKQLSFMKKKQTPVSVAEKPSIPVERPPKPNREKERAERFIPEPIRRNRPHFRDDRTSDTIDHHRNSRREDYRNPPPRDDEKRRRERSRSLTWSPEDKKRKSESSRDKRNREKKKRGESVEDEETQRRRDSKKRKRDRSPSSRSSSSDSDYDRHEKRHRKREKSRK